MTEFTPIRKVLLSIFCAFSFIAYIPLACAVGNDIKEDADYAVAGEISTIPGAEETTDSIEDSNFAA